MVETTEVAEAETEALFLRLNSGIQMLQAAGSKVFSEPAKG
jgi:hypothetical protein